jgi:hydroxymethylglutaryl-CoA lyase
MYPEGKSLGGKIVPDVEIIEVSPRDGIQNEKTLLSLEDRLELIRMSAAAGAARIEAVSFVNPNRVPQMAHAEEICAALPALRKALAGTPGERTRYIGLALNRKGFDRALETVEATPGSLDEVNYVVVASDTFNNRNQGADTFVTAGEFGGIARDARGRIDAGVTVGASFGCPFEGEVPLARLLSVVEALAAHDPFEIALADTIGVGVPAQVLELVSRVREAVPGVALRCHFHNTRNTGLANAFAAVQAGVKTLDASIGGIGGCPFAPAATGNIPTEDLVYMLHRSGYETGISLSAALSTSQWLQEQLGRPVPGMLVKAGNFPPVPAQAA